jgi:hypothetical protein
MGPGFRRDERFIYRFASLPVFPAEAGTHVDTGRDSAWKLTD